MTPQTQLVRHDPTNGKFGDCYRTCIATVLDLHAAEVPLFYSNVDGDQRKQAVTWLSKWGLTLSQFYWQTEDVDAVLYTMGEMNGDTPMILSGRSSIGCNHSVVIMGGKIVSDPSGNGIVGPCDDGLVWVECISVGPKWSARGIERRDGAEQFDQMSDGEKLRWLDGRSDWKDDHWQDHCGISDCEICHGDRVPLAHL